MLLGIAAEINLANCLTGNETRDSKINPVGELEQTTNNKKFVPVTRFSTEYALERAA